ncbi:MAG: hypothetical protein RLZZ396_1033 [Planctomycetota bacterium]|jgi:hypothetical protein
MGRVLSLPPSRFGLLATGPQAQYRQFDISVILETIGLECISAHAERFLKSGLGASPPVKGQLFTGQLALLRYHLLITTKCNFINVPILRL